MFEVDPATPANNLGPTPLKALGRFAHEAVVVDPHRGDVYLTEDASSPNGLVFRLSPTDRTHGYGALRNGGTCRDALQPRGTHVPDLSVFSTPGTTLDVTGSPSPIRRRHAVDPQAVRRHRGDPQPQVRRRLVGRRIRQRQRPGPRPRKPQGRDGAHRVLLRSAQRWLRRRARRPGVGFRPGHQTLTLELYLPVNPHPSSDIPDGPDNICVSPYGGFFLAEDGEGVQHLLAVDDARQRHGPSPGTTSAAPSSPA